MIRRGYGSTGEKLSIIGFPGIVVSGVDSGHAAAEVAFAVDHGINYFDVAPAYGNAQEMLGPALKPFRDGVFLACKTKHRDGNGARADLENSLRLLETDHFDLYQMHSMKSQEDLDEATAPGGALEAISRARDQGLVRYVGFSAHSAEIAVALLDQFQFDSVLFPVNWVNYFESGFGPQIMEKAAARGAARLALKGMASHLLHDPDSRVREKCWYHPVEDRETAALALRWTLSQPITAAVPPGDPELFHMAVELGEEFEPIAPREIDELRAAASGLDPLFQLEHA